MVFAPIKCSETDIMDNEIDGFKILNENIDNLYCLDLASNSSFKIGGNYDLGDFSGIELRI